MEQEIEDPLEMCLAWVQIAVPRTSPPSLTRISLNKVKEMIMTYPNIREETEKLNIKKGLKNLLDLPIQFVPDLLSFVLSSLQVSASLVYMAFKTKPLFLFGSILLQEERTIAILLWIFSSSLRFFIPASPSLT